MAEKKVILNQIVPAGHGIAFEIKKGQFLTITDLEGKQIVDFMTFENGDVTKYMSVAHTRSTYEGYDIKAGDFMVTLEHKPIVKLAEDTCGVHDMSFPCCNTYMYEELGIKNHRSCRSNFADVLAKYGMEEWQLPDPFNFFQNSPNMKLLPNNSKPGDYVKLQFLLDAVAAVSACPFDLYGVNGGKATPIGVTVTEESV